MLASRRMTEQVIPAKGPRRVGIIVILGALSAFAPLSIDMYLPSLPTLTRELGTSSSITQLTLTACLGGLALGQLLAGPISDQLGRRLPLLVGLVVYAASALLCAVAPSVWPLIALRFIQGTAGATGIVIARAIVRDLYSGAEAARFFVLLMLVGGLAPMVAPVFGGQLLRFTSWRGVFVTLSAIGALLLIAAATSLPETLSEQRRRTGGLGDTLSAFRRLLTDLRFLGYVVPAGLAAAAMFGYISGASFVLQDIYGLSPQTFSVVFATNALGLWAAAQVGGRLVSRLGPARLLATGLTTSAIGGVAVLISTLAQLGLPGLLPSLFIVVASVGVVSPNATALALSDYPRDAGSASAVLGVALYLFGGAAAPLVGLGGTETALPMATVIAGMSLAALAIFGVLGRLAPRPRVVGPA